MTSRLDLVVVIAAVVAGALLIEHRHRVVIDPPAPVALAARMPTPPCPDSDNVPYSIRCISFMEGYFWSRASAAETTPRR